LSRLLAIDILSRFNLIGSGNIFFSTLTQRIAPPAAFWLPLAVATLISLALGLVIIWKG
jgi:hypothetical protein